jgi:hypothetical protein
LRIEQFALFDNKSVAGSLRLAYVRVYYVRVCALQVSATASHPERGLAVTPLQARGLVRSLIVGTAVLPVLGVSVFHPASGVVSDSLASSGRDGWWQTAVTTGFLASAAIEFWALGQREGGFAWPFFTAVVWTTWRQPTLADGNACDGVCVAHQCLVVLLAAVETWCVWLRGYGVATAAAISATAVALGCVYVRTAHVEAFDFDDTGTRYWLRSVGFMELSLLLAVRALAASVDDLGAFESELATTRSGSSRVVFVPKPSHVFAPLAPGRV